MIIFLCPTCRTQFRLPESQGGTKINCSACNQRILVPPALNKTTLGVTVPSSQPISTSGQTLPAVLVENSSPKLVPPPIAPSSAIIYYYMHLGKRNGPVAFDRLQQLMETRELLPDALVWSSANK